MIETNQPRKTPLATHGFASGELPISNLIQIMTIIRLLYGFMALRKLVSHEKTAPEYPTAGVGFIVFSDIGKRVALCSAQRRKLRIT